MLYQQLKDQRDAKFREICQMIALALGFGPLETLSPEDRERESNSTLKRLRITGWKMPTWKCHLSTQKHLCKNCSPNTTSLARRCWTS